MMLRIHFDLNPKTNPLLSKLEHCNDRFQGIVTFGNETISLSGHKWNCKILSTNI